MKHFCVEEVLKMEENKKVLVHLIDDSEEDCWIICLIEKSEEAVRLKDIDFDGEVHGYLTDVDSTLDSFCKVYEYIEEEAKRLVVASNSQKSYFHIKEVNQWEIKLIYLSFTKIIEKVSDEEKNNFVTWLKDVNNVSCYSFKERFSQDEQFYFKTGLQSIEFKKTNCKLEKVA